MDRTTKLLLFAIALGLWINLVGAWVRPVPVQAQSLGDSANLSDMVKELKGIHADTSALKEAVGRIWVSMPAR